MAHAPGHLRDAFVALVDEDRDAYDDCFDREPLHPVELLQRLADCDDVMPRDLCEQLDLLQPGWSYAVGVGAYLVKSGDSPGWPTD
jgi:hypothetical protein